MTVKVDLIKANEDGDKYFMYENVIAVLFDIIDHKKLLRVALDNGKIMHVDASNIKNMEVR